MKRRLAIILATAAAVAILLPAIPAHASVLTYDCNPSSSGWNLEGAWGDGSVMESRACIRTDTVTGDVQGYYQFRTRRGGTPILSDWNLSLTTAAVHSNTTGADYGYRASYGDVFNTSIVNIQTLYDCSPTGGNHSYFSWIHNVQANPNGSLPASGYKDANSLTANDSFIVCN